MDYSTSNDNYYSSQNGSNMGNGAYMFENMWHVPVTVTFREGYIFKSTRAFLHSNVELVTSLQNKRPYKWNSLHTQK